MRPKMLVRLVEFFNPESPLNRMVIGIDHMHLIDHVHAASILTA
jgi:hypothetical protein